MTTSNKDLEKIDSLLSREIGGKIIDFIPYTPTGTNFSPLEDYMEETFLPAYAEKIIFLTLVFSYYFDCSIYIHDESGALCQNYKELESNTDIREQSPECIATYLRDIILNDRPVTASFLLRDRDCLLQVEGGFSNVFYGEDPEFNNLLERLSAQQGLFIKPATW